MKSRILIVAVLAFLVACDTASNVEPVFHKYFVTYYGTEGDQYGVDVVVNDDGTMLLLGNSMLLSGMEYPFVIKVDPKGAVIWEVSLGPGGEKAVDVEPIESGPNAGKYIVAANRTTSASSTIKLYIIDQAGAINKEAEIPMHPGGTQQVVTSITPIESSGFLITGYADGALIRESSPSMTSATDLQDILCFSLDDQLAIVDTLVTKGGEQNGTGVKIFSSPAGTVDEFALFGYSDRPYDTDEFRFRYTYDVIVGGVPVGKMIGTNSEQNFLAAAIETPQAPGAGYLMAGTSRTSDLAADVYLVKLNDNMKIKTFDRKLELGTNMECVAADNAPNGFYVLANEIVDGGVRNIVVVKTGPDGVEEWARSFGSAEGDDHGGAIKSLPDGRIAVVATMDLEARKKMALLVLNSDGDL